MRKITDFLFKRNVRVIRLIYFVLNHPQHWMKLIRKMVNQHLFSAYKISLGGGDTALKIGCNLRIPHPQNIVLGSGCTIGDNVTIYHDVTLGQNRGKYPTIGNNVIIYAGAKVIGDVTVGGALLDAMQW
ncbi:serine O-acetyltransferase [Allofournierella sp.]|uniref:serine O-acetyltransferase n=1 Tax=Allofournierella sp. TaxID=1940256 RepID=UPI003AB890F2